MKRPLKIAFIIPRYHVSQAGGAEILVERLAERLFLKGHSVEVLTTCANDHTRWESEIPEGVEKINGIEVHRFRIDPRVNFTRFVSLQQRIDRGWPLSLKEEEAWIAGSLHSQVLYQALKDRREEWDALVFAPYLFGITYRGLQIAPEKSFLIPCLHPEPYAYLKIFQSMFRKPRGILFNSIPEKELGKKLFEISEERCAVVGMGFHQKTYSNGSEFREKFKLGSGPFILYAGRREKGKNTPLLIEYFLTYKKHHPGDLKLILLGSGKIPYEGEKVQDVIDLGYVSAADMDQAYQSAAVVCQPSVNESFAIVLMESWLASTPVLVNGKCAVTRDHVQRSGGGLWFNNYFEFEECINLFVKDEHLRNKIAIQGKQYVVENFDWEDVLERFLKAIEKGLEHK